MMNFNDLFRSVFGFSASPYNRDIRDDDSDDDDEIKPKHWNDGRTFGDLNDQFFRETQDMFSHFQEMFSNFGIAEFPQIGFPEIEQGGSQPKKKSPRNEMLKSDEDTNEKHNEDSSSKPNWFSPSQRKPFLSDIFKIPSLDVDPHSNQGRREDVDLDEHIDSSNLDLILSKDGDRPTKSPSQKSFFRSISVRTIRRPDGTVETHRTEKDSEGNVKTTITSTDHNGHPMSIIGDEGRPFIKEREEDIPPLKDKQSASIFNKLFGSW